MNQVVIFNRTLSQNEINILANYPKLLTITNSPTTNEININLGLEFFLEFTSTTVPTQATIGGTLTKTIPTGKEISIFNDTIRGNVLKMTGDSGSSVAYITTSYTPPNINFTTSFWYNTPSNAIANIVSSARFAIFMYSSKVTIEFKNPNGTTNGTSFSDTTNRGVNTWTHYTFTYNGSIAILYVNGISNKSLSRTLDSTASGPLFINSFTGNQFGTTAYFDKIRSYNRVLSEAEVSVLYLN
jgi:hypothetical protein